MLVRRHQGRVRGYLRQLARDPAAADDIAQETFIRAWDRIETFAGKGRFVSWLMAIAHKQFLQALRQGRRRRTLAEDLAEDDAGNPGTDRPLVADGADAADADRLLSALSEDERNAMLLAYGFGLSHAEVTEVTGLPLGTVKSHIRRGRDKLRERFDIESSNHA